MYKIFPIKTASNQSTRCHCPKLFHSSNTFWYSEESQFENPHSQDTSHHMYSEKVNILPIEGDGNKINPNCQTPLSNKDMESGHLDKEPSRIIISDITTIDKARLDCRIGKISPEYMSKFELFKKRSRSGATKRLFEQRIRKNRQALILDPAIFSPLVLKK